MKRIKNYWILFQNQGREIYLRKVFLGLALPENTNVFMIGFYQKYTCRTWFGISVEKLHN